MPTIPTEEVTAQDTAIARVCLTCGGLHYERKFCSDECRTALAKDAVWEAKIATHVVATRPQYDGVGMIGALDEWVRWAA